jgi:hypothetical protein
MVLIILIVLTVIVAVIAIKKKKAEKTTIELKPIELVTHSSEIVNVDGEIEMPAHPGGDPGVNPDSVEAVEIVKPKKKKAVKKKTAKTAATKKARVKKSTSN